MRPSCACFAILLCWMACFGCDVSGTSQASITSGGAPEREEPTAPDCNAVCGHLVEQCMDATSSDDVTSCLRDCEEDLAEPFAICDNEVAAYTDCCQTATRAELCPSGEDADIKRCDAACPSEAETLRACGEVIVTCAQVCARIETACEDERDPACRRECMGDMEDAEAAGMSAVFSSMLECCMETEQGELTQLCDEDAFDPCSALCGITEIEELRSPGT